MNRWTPLLAAAVLAGVGALALTTSPGTAVGRDPGARGTGGDPSVPPALPGQPADPARPGDPHAPPGPHDPHDPDAPDDSDCATGCGALPANDTHLSAERYETLLRRFASQPPSADSEALEALLFHGADARHLLEERGAAVLDARRLALLREELARTHVRLSLRLVEANGTVRASFGPGRVPLGQKRHLAMTETDRLQTPEISGTVKRVGLHHLWTRW